MDVQQHDVNLWCDERLNVCQLSDFHRIFLTKLTKEDEQLTSGFSSSDLVLRQLKRVVLPRLERVLERSMMVCLLGLLRTERLAKEMSAVTRVMDILKQWWSAPVTALVNWNISRTGCGTFLPALKLVFQKVKECLLHHVCHLSRNRQQTMVWNLWS